MADTSRARNHGPASGTGKLHDGSRMVRTDRTADPPLSAPPMPWSLLLGLGVPIPGRGNEGLGIQRMLQLQRLHGNRAVGRWLAERSPADGGPLPGPLRGKMERAFGADFSDVRIHVGNHVDEAGARAFTRGPEIHVASGSYDPEGRTGQELIGHELAHVVQQRTGRAAGVQGKEAEINADPLLEAEADARGTTAAGGGRITIEAGGARPVGSAAPEAPIQGKWVRLPFPLWHNAWYWVDDGTEKGPVPEGGAEVTRPDQREITGRYHSMQSSYAALPSLDTILEQHGYASTRAEEPPVKRIESVEVLFRRAQAAMADANFAVAIPLLEQLNEQLPRLSSEEVKQVRIDPSLLQKDLFRKLRQFSAVVPLLMEHLASSTEATTEAVTEAAAGPAKDATTSGSGKKTSQKSTVKPDDVKEIIRLFEEFRSTLPKSFLRDYVEWLLKEANEGLREQQVSEYRRAAPSLLDHPEFRALYAKLAAEKFKVAHGKEADRGEGAAAQLIPDLAKRTGEEPVILWQKVYLLEHLKLPVDKGNLAKPIEQLLRDNIYKKADRIKHLFEQNREVYNTCLSRIQEAKLHQLLVDMIEGQKPHSIHDINDYVGDKLNDPLMDWIISKGIPVEIHATSTLASFAQLSSQGFTDIIEIPSTHTGTKKYIVHNPKTGTVKVVLQSLPGRSYAVQTSGAFLFYELYAYDMSLAKSIIPEPNKPFKHGAYKARSVLSYDQQVARYLLIDPAQPALVAELPCRGLPRPYKIDADGAILVDEHLKDAEVKITPATIKRMPLKQLSVFEEPLDYTQIYLDCMQAHGVSSVDIALMGNSGAFEQEMAANKKNDPRRTKIKSSFKINAPYFSATVFHLKPNITLLSFPISPHFFGDKAGSLVRALNALGVKHLIFTGKGGGLDLGAEVGDIVFPKHFASIAEGRLESAAGVENKAPAMLGGLPPDDKIKLSETHVGVHSAITESAEMIKFLQEKKISSVDCEGGFIAEALKGTGISLYHCMRLSDVPNTQQSIGMGGTTGETRSSVKHVDQLDITFHILEKIIVQKIEANQQKAQQNPFSIDSNGTIRNLRTSSEKGARLVNLSFDFLLPSVDKDDYAEEKAAAMALFAKRVSAILQAHGGIADAGTFKDIISLTQEFYSLYKIKIEAKYVAV